MNKQALWWYTSTPEGGYVLMLIAQAQLSFYQKGRWSCHWRGWCCGWTGWKQDGLNQRRTRVRLQRSVTVSSLVQRAQDAASCPTLWWTSQLVVAPPPGLHLYLLEQDEGRGEMLAQCGSCSVALQRWGLECFGREGLDRWWTAMEWRGVEERERQQQSAFLRSNPHSGQNFFSCLDGDGRNLQERKK